MTTLFPRSVKYDPAWVADNLMGPNVLWLTESLCSRLELRPDMRVMDLGCGKALSSIFLAKEFGVQVWATDLWIKPTENWERIRQASLQDRVFPVYAEARSLPYADEFFDVIASVDAYHYFGTDDLYLERIVRFLKPDGRLAIACPAYKQELTENIPDYLREAYHHQQWHSFHTPAWWRRHWEKTGAVEVLCAEEVPEAAEIWNSNAGPGNPDTAVVLADQGRLLTFSRVVARKVPKRPDQT
ncbi:MAG TPA: methyltransferase domain-containing protein [Candidatus Binataceae bacterium]|nr:methyltransferase domain-containing protein [Candidatus Binataceae bacterium]